MKYVIIILVFIVGGGIGYFIGKESTVREKEKAEKFKPAVITEVVYDTIVKKEQVEVPIYIETSDSLTEIEDSLMDAEIADSLSGINTKDTLSEDQNIVIRRERLIKSMQIPITFLTEEVQKDTIIKDLLGIHENKVTRMRVEFWESPLNFTGYKMSKNKLLLYGLSDQFTYQIYKKNKIYYIGYEDILYQLKETQEFLPFKEVAQETILDD
jgi:hypothetical protein